MDEEVLLPLLDQWESAYKKGLLTFWLLLLLCERPMYVFEMGEALTEISQGSMTADEKSLYRALRRFEAMGLVDSTWQRSDLGPRRRYYRPTPLGHTRARGLRPCGHQRCADQVESDPARRPHPDR